GQMLGEWVLEHFHCMLEVLERPRGHGFRLVPRRWLVERTLAWISRCRRLSQDDEKLPRAWETSIYLAMIELMLKRVAETLATSKTPS
ncbi:MAG: DDE transposase, partial [Cyanobacteria bacterium QH_6_48_35]